MTQGLRVIPVSVFERVYGVLVSADFDDWDHPVASLRSHGQVHAAQSASGRFVCALLLLGTRGTLRWWTFFRRLFSKPEENSAELVKVSD
jgi:hypothetical protein